MKLLVLLFLVGYAAANIYAPLDDAADEFYRDFMLGMEEAGSLREALDFPFDHPLLQEAEDDVKNEIAERLRKTLDEILEKMKDSLDKGKMFKEDLQAKLDEIRSKLKDLKIDMGTKARELMEKVRDRVKNFVRDLIEKLKGKEKRSFEEHADFNLREMFKKLRDQLLQKIDKEKLKSKIEDIFGKGSEMADSLLDLINKKGDKYKQKLLDLVDRFLGKDEEKRSIKEVWEKIKDYFKDLHIDLKEKYMKFGEWVKEIYDKGLEKGKTKMENIRNIAREFIDHTKGVSKEVAEEALEFLRPYKEDLGSLWDQVRETVKDIVQRKD